MMWRYRMLAVVAALVGCMALGLSVAYGIWWWNAEITVQDADVRTQWTVGDDPGHQGADRASIKLALSEGAVASVKNVSHNERFSLVVDDDLECLDGEIEFEAEYKVTAKRGRVGHLVEVTVTADGDPVASGTGNLGQRIRVSGVIPGSCSG